MNRAGVWNTCRELPGRATLSLSRATFGIAMVMAVALVASAVPALAQTATVSDPYLWFADVNVESWGESDMSEGIPRIRYGDQLQTNPVTVAQWGLAHYSQGDTGTALRASDWLVQQQQPDGTWVYTFDYPMPFAGSTMHAPWVSALAQGQAMSLLARAWEATGDPAYLAAARLAVKPFSVPVEDGGVLQIWQGMPFFEEYAQPGQPTLVLNGFLFSLIGLRDCARAPWIGETPASPGSARASWQLAIARLAR